MTPGVGPHAVEPAQRRARIWLGTAAVPDELANPDTFPALPREYSVSRQPRNMSSRIDPAPDDRIPQLRPEALRVALEERDGPVIHR